MAGSPENTHNSCKTRRSPGQEETDESGLKKRKLDDDTKREAMTERKIAIDTRKQANK